MRTYVNRNHSSIIKFLFLVLYPIYYLFSMDGSLGAQTTLHCVLKDFKKLEKGKYFDNCAVKNTNSKLITTENEDRLWEVSAKLVKL